MVTSVEPRTLEFRGNKEQRELAAAVFAVAQSHGRFMAIDAAIRLPLAAVAEFMAGSRDGVTEEKIEAAVAANPSVFALETVEEQRILVTSRSGVVPPEARPRSLHTFAQRFMTPLPKPEAPPQPPKPRVRVAPSWATWEAALGDLSASTDAIEYDEGTVTIERPAALVGPATIEPREPFAPILEPAAEFEPAAEPELDLEPLPEPTPARTITVPMIPSLDVAAVDDEELAAAVRERLRADIRVANFGEHWMAEENVPRFSRGDLRRMKEYIQEQEQPLTDDVLVQDVLMVRPNAPDFELMRFAVNFRLTREHRDFDFVGTTNQRFWSTSGLPQIGTTRRKPNELGTDYRFLVDETTEAPAYRSIRSVDHVLTFFEYHHGLLPYDAEMQRLLPAPVLPDQRSAVLTFETPQSYTTYLVELRYPTPNRGGFILGLDDFFAENLVPGALISISRTDNDGHYQVEFLAAGNQQARLLELDERRAQRYVFRPTTYTCAVADDWLLTEERFPRLGSEKPLDEKVRRRPEAVVAATIERIGHKGEEPGYAVQFQDLLAAVNVERPFSERNLRHILETDETGAFARDPDGSDAYTYVPGSGS
jgi:hypothetical protein